MRRFSVLAALAAGMLLAFLPNASAANGPKNKDNDTYVQLLAFNDFHGNLLPPSGSSGRIAISPTVNVNAGGMEYFATWIKQLRDLNSNTITVSAGDNIGASPLLSALFHDEPTIEALNSIGTDVAAVGNHEFDEGSAELLRMQYGGCHPVDGCQDGTPFFGSLFQYLAANVFWAGTDETILPAYEVVKVDNAKIAFIGLTLEGTPLIVTPSGVAGLEFRPEVPVVNNLVHKLRDEQGVRAFVVVIHQGGQQNPPYAAGFQDVNTCQNFTGAITPIVQQLDPQVDLVISAHTHQPYICDIAGTPVTSASSFGRLITDINLVIDHQTKDVKSVEAHNVIVTRNVAKDAAITSLIDHYTPFYAPKAFAVVGSITQDITRTANPAGETPLGNLIADGMLAATSPTDFGGAVIAFMNSGGVRADLVYSATSGTEAPGEITYAEAFNVQPFGNTLVVKTLTGAQIYHVLEQQWSEANLTTPKVMHVSSGFSYTWDAAAAPGARVVPGSVTLNGTMIDPLASYRVAMNNFMADGGDGYSVFTQGTDQLGGEVDLDAFVRYLHDNSPVSPPALGRITRLH